VPISIFRYPLFRRAGLALLLSLGALPAARAAEPDSHQAALEQLVPLMIAALEAGKFDHARDMAEQAIAWQPKNPVHRYNLACIEARAGVATQPRAIALLEQAVALGFNNAELLQSDPDLASLHEHPRFPAFVASAARNALTADTARPSRPPALPPRIMPLATATGAASAPVATAPVEQALAPLPPLAPKSGHIIGRAVTAAGQPLPAFKVAYSGFEDGKLANSFGGRLTETVSNTVPATRGRYEVKVPAGAYRVSTYVSYRFRDREYNFELEPINPPARHDFDGLGLDKLNQGLVRDFRLRMTGKRMGAAEDSETLYKRAYHGGRLDLDAGQYTGLLGGGNKLTPALREALPADSRVTITLQPEGPMVDGSAGRTVTATVRLGDAGKWTFSQRGIYPGAYVATARATTPDGVEKPLHVSLVGSSTKIGRDGQYDSVTVDWKDSVVVDFLPNGLGPVPRFGVQPVTLYLGP
jgi:hypothetical protein